MKKNFINPISMAESNKENPLNSLETAPSTRPSLFSSICAAESQSAVDAEIAKHAQRVGFVLKVLYGRELSVLRDCFLDKLSLLVQETCSAIDHELHTTKEVNKS